MVGERQHLPGLRRETPVLVMSNLRIKTPSHDPQQRSNMAWILEQSFSTWAAGLH